MAPAIQPIQEGWNQSKQELAKTLAALMAICTREGEDCDVDTFAALLEHARDICQVLVQKMLFKGLRKYVPWRPLKTIVRIQSINVFLLAAGELAIHVGGNGKVLRHPRQRPQLRPLQPILTRNRRDCALFVVAINNLMLVL